MAHETVTSGADASVDDLTELPLDALRAEWQRLYRAIPSPRLSKDMLIRGVAYRRQEQVQGGLRPAAKRRLVAWTSKLANGDASTAATPSVTQLKPGSVLVRAWRGQTHSVRVLDDGFDYRGERHTSLSQIATRITGAHWSGPRFFGLVRRQKQQGDG